MKQAAGSVLFGRTLPAAFLWDMAKQGRNFCAVRGAQRSKGFLPSAPPLYYNVLKK